MFDRARNLLRSVSNIIESDLRRLYEARRLPLPHHWLTFPYESMEAPILIGGPGRSGSTLISLMLNAHPEIYCGEEYGLLRLQEFSIPRIAKTYTLDCSYLHQLTRQSICRTQFLEQVIRLIKEQEGVSRFATKSPHYLFSLGDVFQSFPSAKFIFTCRDGRDVALSMRQNMQYIGLRSDVTYDETGLLSWEYCAQEWAMYVNAFKGWRNDSRCYLLRYEDIVEEPTRVLHELFGFLGIAYHPDTEDFTGKGASNRRDLTSPHLRNLKRPLLTSRIFRWKNEVCPREIAIFERHAAPELSYLGYEV